MHPFHFRTLIVRPSLKAYPHPYKADSNLWDAAGEEILMLTWAQETLGGQFIKQGWKSVADARGVGRGPFSMEPTTFNWLKSVFKIIPEAATADQLIYDFRLATLAARLRYLVAKPALPAATDILGLANYWDQHYNGNPDAGFPADAVRNYERYVLRG